MTPCKLGTGGFFSLPQLPLPLSCQFFYCSVIFLVLLQFRGSTAIKVYVSHEDLKQDYPTGLALKDPPTAKRLRDLTMCMRFKFYVLKRTYILTSRPFITR